jgi:deoxycytidine triphosphate deaminase
MSVLSEREVIRALGRNIIVLPFISRENNLRACDIKLTASEFAYIFEKSSPNFPNPTRCIANNGTFLIPAHKTAIIWTEEFIYLSNSLCGSLHSKVSLVSKGLGHIGTRVNPNWGGILAIALHNHSYSDVAIRVGETIAYLRLHRLTSKSYHKPEKGGKLEDVISGIYTPPPALEEWLTDQQKIWEENDEKAFCKKFRNHPPYQNARKEYESILRRLDVTRWNQNIWVIIAAIASLLSAIAAIVAIVPKDTSSASTSTKLEESTKSISSPTTPKNVK